MILVTTGTNAPAFDRLLRAVEHFPNGERLVVQHGPSKLRPPGARCVDYLAFDQFVELVREARVVITHAGVGSILTTLMNGKRPFVVPRRARFAEHVDDHQVELARRLDQIGLITLVEEPGELAGAIEGDQASQQANTSVQPGALVGELRTYLRATVNGR